VLNLNTRNQPLQIAVCFALLMPGLIRSADNEIPTDFYERVSKACIEILVDDHLEGSGWIAEETGVIVTAAHVVPDPSKRIEVLLPGGGRVDATVIASDRGNDAALLRIPTRAGGYPTLPFAKEAPVAGTPIYLYGTPIQRHGVLLRGVVARNDTYFEFYTYMMDYVEIVHVTGVGPPGTSGGPWLNTKGEVIGLNSGMMRDNGAPSGVGCFSQAKPIQALLKSKQNAQTATLCCALEETWQQSAAYLKKLPPRTEGVVILKLKVEGPLGRAQIKDKEVIVAAGDKPMRMPNELITFIRSKKPGEEVKLKILSPEDGATREATVRLDDQEPARR
jgi:serine protease Do